MSWPTNFFDLSMFKKLTFARAKNVEVRMVGWSDNNMMYVFV